MRISRRHRRRALGLVGVGVATTATVALPVASPVSAGPASPAVDAGTTAPASGTYESCSAWFGYGKTGTDIEPLELTTFDVSVVGDAAEGPAPTVENGAVDVVLVLTDLDGNVARCVPQQVTEDDWIAAWGLAGQMFRIPPFPGPGHYVYPITLPQFDTESDPNPRSVPVADAPPPAIPGLDSIAAVDVEVVAVDAPYTLASPVGVAALPQVFAGMATSVFAGELPSPMAAVIEAAAGTDAVAAAQLAFTECFADEGLVDPSNASSPDLVAGVNALLAASFVVPPITIEAPVQCSGVEAASTVAIIPLGIAATSDASTPITLRGPDPAPAVPTFTG